MVNTDYLVYWKMTLPLVSNIELKEIVRSQIEQIAKQNERLEKLEQIALGLTKSTDLASIAP